MCRQNGFDAIVATAPPNVFYSSAFYSLGQRSVLTTKVFSVVTPGATPLVTLVVPAGEVDLAIEEGHSEVRLWPFGSFFFGGMDPQGEGNDGRLSRALASARADEPLHALNDLFKHLGLCSCRIAVDEVGLTWVEWNRLSAIFPGRMEPGYSLWQEIRMVKTPAEVGILKQAAQLTTKAISHALANLTEGMTERELVTIYEKHLLEHGAATAESVILFGPHSAYPSGSPGNQRLKRGDIVRFDCGCTLSDYYADLARNVVYGDPGADVMDKVSRYHNAMLTGVQEGIAIMKPGVRASQVFEVATSAVRKSGVPHYRRTHCGHGIGVELYDRPVVRQTEDTEIEAGMVFCIETPFYELGLGGIQVEDAVVVTESGVEYLVSPSDPLERM